MIHSPFLIRAGLLTWAALSFAALAPGQTAKATSLVTLHQDVPTVLSRSVQMGKPAPTAVLNVSISLAPSDYAGLNAFANDVSNPKSPNYRQFITPSEVGTRFGASSNTVNLVTSYLKSKGLTLTLVAKNRMAILAKGTVAKVEKAFNTTLANYRTISTAEKGRHEFYSFTKTPQLPKTFASEVIAIGNLENFTKPLPRLLDVTQTRGIYGLAPLYDTGGYHGEGRTIAISNFDGYRLSNLPLFYSTYGLPTPTGGVGANVTKVGVGGSDGETETPGGEGDLDIQMVLGMAPKSTFIIYDGVTSDLVSVLTREAEDDLADIISESYGWRTGEDTRSMIVAAHDQHLAMTAQGITYVLATGDYGTDLQGFDYPNFDPEILMVGGTVATSTGTNTRASEVGWNGSGSGWSTFDIDFNTLPSWLVGDNVPTSINRRIFPDLALNAAGGNTGGAIDFDGYYFVLNGSITTGAGTSFSAPVFAGQLGVGVQAMIDGGGLDPLPNGKYRLGRINDLVYSWNGNSDIFFDVTGGDSGQLPNGDESVGTAGWDFVTGWGAPNMSSIVNLFLSNGTTTVTDYAIETGIYSLTSPALTLGTSPSGSASNLTTADGANYSVKSIKQTGMGQVATAIVKIQLTGSDALRASASVTVAAKSPSKTTNFLYLKNWLTGDYDQVSITPASGSVKTTTVTVDLDKYVSGGQIWIMDRALLPTRLGSSQFTLNLDQVTATERIRKA